MGILIAVQIKNFEAEDFQVLITITFSDMFYIINKELNES